VIRFSLRGLLSRKLRSVLTAVAIVLGVALVSGTYVLTDSITKAFDSIFQTVYRGTDATITGRNALDTGANDVGGGDTTTPSFDQSLLARVRALPEVKAAIGGVAGEPHLVKNGKAIGIGANCRNSGNASSRSTSGGTTSSAPRTRAAARPRATQCTTVKQPRLCASRTTGFELPVIARSSVPTHASRRGSFQSSCSTRR